MISMTSESNRFARHLEKEPTSDLVRLVERAMEQEPTLAFLPAFLEAHKDAGCYLVGGAIRDVVLGRLNKDFDFVVTGLSPDEIETWFGAHGRVDLAGRNFGVFKFLPEGYDPQDHEFIDIALPRSEQASAESVGGYRDFDMQIDKHLSVESDLSRRDFTMNAMAYDVRAKKLVDPFGGAQDIEDKIIRTVGDPHKRFGEDYSRVLRGIRFVCQLDFSMDPSTWDALVQRMMDINKTRSVTKEVVSEDGQVRLEETEEYVVPRETIGRELSKALYADPFTAADRLFRSAGMRELAPEVDALIEQNRRYHGVLEGASQNTTLAVSLLLRDVEPRILTRDDISSFVMNLRLKLKGRVHDQIVQEYTEASLSLVDFDDQVPALARRLSEVSGQPVETLSEAILQNRESYKRRVFQHTIKDIVRRLGLHMLEPTNKTKINEDDVIWIVSILQQEHSNLMQATFLLDVFEKIFHNPRGAQLLRAKTLLGEESLVQSVQKVTEQLQERFGTTGFDLPSPLVTGREVMQAKGVRKGGRWLEGDLRAIRHAQLAGEVTTAQEALVLLVDVDR